MDLKRNYGVKVWAGFNWLETVAPENTNVPSVSIKAGEFLKQPGHYRLLEEDYIP
jgi:hypothetical protein